MKSAMLRSSASLRCAQNDKISEFTNKALSLTKRNIG